MSDIVNFRLKLFRTDKGHHITSEENDPTERGNIDKHMCTEYRSTYLCKTKLLKLRYQIKANAILVEDFNILLLQRDKSTKQKKKKTIKNSGAEHTFE